jgi:RhtB (resistance to homoserine/threonine) family protein
VHSSFLIFLGVAALLTITPGADTAVVTKAALGDGRRAAMLTTLGINTGILVWGTASAAGLAAVLTASSTVFTAIKLLGAAYLLWLGAQALWGTFRGHAPEQADDAAGARERRMSAGAAYRQGLLSNVLNPKVGVFYTTFLPQFIGPGDPVFAKSVLLAGIHDLMGLLWLVCYSYVVTRAGDLLRRPPIRRAVDRLTGVVLIGFGLRLAAAKS